MASQPPPDLGVLCTKLSSTPAIQLPHALPVLTRHVVRCKDALSAPQEQKLKDNASQSSLLIHKIKTQIITLLNGRSREGRFAAVGLVKAVIDVGGWEMLRGSEPWVRGLLSIMQKGDSFACKELAVVTLTRIYMLLHPYPTLAREIATATLPAFITASLQIVKSDGSVPLAAPCSIVMGVCEAFAALIPLYPTTFRPHASQIRSSIRLYLAPTTSDAVFVPPSLQRAAGRLTVTLHHVAAKSGGSDEWAKLMDGFLRDLHLTADQVFRAVDESWEAKGNFQRAAVALDGVPNGGGVSADQLPTWQGLSAGAQRIMGLLGLVSDALCCQTKGAVEIPLGAIMTAVSRICSIARLSPKAQSWHQAVETNPAIGRDERDELWSVMPDLHVGAMEVVLVMLRRLQQSMLPLVQELSDHVVRVFKSGMDVAAVRKTGYLVLANLLSLAGPTLPKQSVAMVELLVIACCRDLQHNASLSVNSPSMPATDTKANAMANADLFLQPSSAPSPGLATTKLDLDHAAAATNLLPVLLSHLPQQHIKPSLRGLVDRTAILTRNRDAMLASVLNPYRDSSGRMLPSILPHLSRQFPHDQALEVLRCNMRTSSAVGNGSHATLAEVPNHGISDETSRSHVASADVENEHDSKTEDSDDRIKVETELVTSDVNTKPAAILAPPPLKANLALQSSAFIPRALSTTDTSLTDSQPKRKHPGSDASPAKRQEREKPAPVMKAPQREHLAADEDDSDESAHLNMELDEDDDEEDDDDDDEKSGQEGQ
ncbi:hypothetical protein CDD82_3447 [Ophiocordyceps australis]|uniref:Pre-rRNA-processing protein RIX1 n=1 Tax=Ophiocordyceps australis TaxID=1399860 RepID=A0A2C5YHS5_9HYPO|nr:hypothetical protein CDD82_3447 [Ophiocordyceps australis]